MKAVDVIDRKFVSGLTNSESANVFARVFHQAERSRNSQSIEHPKSAKSGDWITFLGERGGY